MITVENLVRHFQDPKKGVVKAVDGVSFVAPPGKVFGLLGINGAGKTTVLRMLSTLIRPSSGTASVAGHDVVHEPEHVRSKIGFLSASTAVYGRLTAYEVLEYFGELYGLAGPELKSRVQHAATAMNLSDFGSRLCDKMSTGQKQRVSIARSILHDPPVYFFDEPTAGLDVVTAQTVMEFIEQSKTQGKTILFSTHIMSEAERLCDEIAVVHQGKIVATGTRDALLAQTGEISLERAFLSLVGYQNPAVAS